MAVSGMGGLSGAAGGAMLGAQVGGPWGAALGGAAGGIAGLFGDEKGTAPMRVNQWLEDPMFSWMGPLYEQQAGFYGDELSRIQRGEAPSYWGGLESAIRGQQYDSLNQRYMGVPGERAGSILDLLKGTGAQTGLGQGRTQAAVTKGLRDYSRDAQQIENYITGLRAEDMQKAYYDIPGAINQLRYGPEGEWDSYTIPGTPGSSLGGSLLGLGMQYGKMPSFGGGGGGGGGMFQSPALSGTDVSGTYADMFRGAPSSTFGGAPVSFNPTTGVRTGTPTPSGGNLFSSPRMSGSIY